MQLLPNPPLERYTKPVPTIYKRKEKARVVEPVQVQHIFTAGKQKRVLVPPPAPSPSSKWEWEDARAIFVEAMIDRMMFVAQWPTMSLLIMVKKLIVINKLFTEKEVDSIFVVKCFRLLFSYFSITLSSSVFYFRSSDKYETYLDLIYYRECDISVSNTIFV